MGNLDTRITSLPSSVYALALRVDKLAGRSTKPQHRRSPQHNSTEQEALAQASEATIRIGGERSAPHREDETIRIMTRRNEREARAYCEVLEHIFAEYHNIAITEDAIRSLHEQLFKHADWAQRHRGQYRYSENKVETKDRNGKVLRILVEGTPVSQMPDAMRELLAWFNDPRTSEVYHPLLVISAFISEFLKVHPFYDGNGRLSRMLTNLLLLRAGYDAELYYPHEKLIEDDTERYYLALSHSQKTFGTETESILPWTEYFLGIIFEQTTRAAAIAAFEA